jgi:hypothetical protein
MARPKAYAPESGYRFQLLVRHFLTREFEHCDYAADRLERNHLLINYRSAYGLEFRFKTIVLPKKYWPKIESANHENV